MSGLCVPAGLGNRVGEQNDQRVSSKLDTITTVLHHLSAHSTSSQPVTRSMISRSFVK